MAFSKASTLSGFTHVTSGYTSLYVLSIICIKYKVFLHRLSRFFLHSSNTEKFHHQCLWFWCERPTVWRRRPCRRFWAHSQGQGADICSRVYHSPKQRWSRRWNSSGWCYWEAGKKPVTQTVRHVNNKTTTNSKHSIIYCKCSLDSIKTITCLNPNMTQQHNSILRWTWTWFPS